MAVFFAIPAADAPAQQDGLIQRIGKGVGGLVDGAREALDELGKKAGEALPPLFSSDTVNPDDFTNLKTAVIPFDQSYPVSTARLISVEAEFGEVKVTAWDQQVLRVQAQITVGADSAAKAQELARAIRIGVEESDNDAGFNIKATVPTGTRFQINYDISVPRDANVSTRNYFGDTIIDGVDGEVVVNSSHGRVELKNLARPAHVTASGNELLLAHNLRQGGHFDLEFTQALFESVGGELTVGIFGGSTELRALPQECNVHVTSTSGPVNLFLSQQDKPFIDVTVSSGDVIDVNGAQDLARTVRPNLVRSVSRRTESTQRVRISSWFDNVQIVTEGLPKAPSLPQGLEGERVEDVVAEKSYPIPEGAQVRIEAIAGEVRVEATDGPDLTISALKQVRVSNPANAREALAALAVRRDPSDANVVRIVSAADLDPASLGAATYRIDLNVKCPRNVPLTIVARSGLTTVTGMAAPVTVEQTEGTVEAQLLTGPAVLRNDAGDVKAIDCSGGVTITGAYGTASTSNVNGPQEIDWNSSKRGKVAIDAPLGPVKANCKGGNISIVALSGIGGDYDVTVENGNLSLMMLSSSDALLVLNAERGHISVNNGLTINGTITKNAQTFTCNLNKGRHRVTLNARDGNIALD